MEKLSRPTGKRTHFGSRSSGTCILSIYIDGSAGSIADAICEIESGRRDLNALGSSLRAKALTELDYRKIGEELSREYWWISRNGLLQIETKTVA